MINSEINSVELRNSMTGMATCHKQPPIAAKKVALRDVNNNNSLVRTSKENLLSVDGRPLPDATKVCGTKRFAPDFTPTRAFPPPWSNNGTYEQFMFARRKCELEAGKGRLLGNNDVFPGHPHITKFPSSRQQEIPSKQSQINGKNMPHLPNHNTTTVPGNVRIPKVEVTEFEEINDLQREERFIRLQNFIKHCEISNQRENIQLLQHLSNSELSRYAVALEKRAIQLTIEEGKEMQRMKALNILIKSAPTNNLIQQTQQSHPKN